MLAELRVSALSARAGTVTGPGRPPPAAPSLNVGGGGGWRLPVRGVLRLGVRAGQAGRAQEGRGPAQAGRLQQPGQFAGQSLQLPVTGLSRLPRWTRYQFRHRQTLSKLSLSLEVRRSMPNLNKLRGGKVGQAPSAQYGLSQAKYHNSESRLQNPQTRLAGDTAVI